VTFFQRIRTPFSDPAPSDEARAQPQMRLIGDYLLERREDLGLDLEEVAAMLRIKPAYLAALEQGRTGELPGPTYAIGFIRAYADFLGLDTEQVLARFKAEASGVTARPDLALPAALTERSLPGRAVVLVALILALCGYGLWYYLSTDDRNRPERVAAVPGALQQQQPAPAASAPAPPATPAPPSQPGAAPGATASAAPTAANFAPAAATSPGLTGAAATASTVAAAPPAAPATPPPQPKSPPVATPQPVSTAPQTAPPPAPAAAAPSPAPSAASKVTIRALADCWIQIRTPDQSIVFSRVLKSGEAYNVPARAGLSLRTGNAGALEIAVDGKPVPSIGGIGALRRDVALDPAELAAGTAVHG